MGVNNGYTTVPLNCISVTSVFHSANAAFVHAEIILYMFAVRMQTCLVVDLLMFPISRRLFKEIVRNQKELLYIIFLSFSPKHKPKSHPCH